MERQIFELSAEKIDGDLERAETYLARIRSGEEPWPGVREYRRMETFACEMRRALADYQRRLAKCRK